jgi:hypothetical protein
VVAVSLIFKEGRVFEIGCLSASQNKKREFQTNARAKTEKWEII